MLLSFKLNLLDFLGLGQNKPLKNFGETFDRFHQFLQEALVSLFLSFLYET